METKDRYIVTVEDKEYDIALSRTAGEYIVECNNVAYRVLMNPLGDGKFLFKINETSSEIDITRDGGDLGVFLDGKEMHVRVEPFSLARLRKKAGGTADGPGDKIIRAPMPGLVLRPAVKPGERVNRGKTLVIIEAMKMENIIKAPRDAVVKEVCVEAGQPVEKGEKLVELE
jgi:biotin carboxyl carrier protein